MENLSSHFPALIFSGLANDSSLMGRKRQVINDEDAKFVLAILMYGLTPFISLLGLIGNILSIKILIRHGLHNGSNILLISLAFADICFLIGFNSFPNMLYQLTGDGSFPYSKTGSHLLFILYIIFIFLDYSMGLTSLTLPMLITTERFVAVFFPLKFPSIVTPRRLWIAIGGIYAYWVTYIFYTCFWFEFSYTYDSSRNMSVGLIGRSALFYKDLPSIQALEEIYFSIKIPPLFTLCGCLMIIVKLKFVSRKRLKMTNSISKTQTDRANMKTTQVLLAVCFVYLFTCLILALPTYLPEEWAAYSLTSENPSNMGKIVYQAVSIVVCVNSSWNFTIYVLLNNKFRETLIEIMTSCICRKK